MNILRTAALLAGLALSSAPVARAQNPAILTFPVGNTTVTVSELTPNLRVVWELLWGPDDFLWMTERYGRISRVNPATGQVLPLLTVPDVTGGGEAGLLGMVLHPQFAANPYVYVAYTYTQGAQMKAKLVRYTYSAATATLGSPQPLLTNIPAATGHCGSRLLILADHTLLMTTGDAHLTAEAQDPQFLSGKTLRLNLDGTVPADNPTAGSYVYTRGHRNPQGLVQLPSGRVYSSEHGTSTDDEINRLEAGRNYGWPAVEGYCDLPAEQAFCQANNVREPIKTWTPSIAPAGLAYYDHAAIPGWRGGLLLAVLKDRELLHLPLNAAGDATNPTSTYLLFSGLGRLRALCVSPQGRVYVGTSNYDGYGTPNPTDDRILVLENRSFATASHQGNAAPAETFAVFPNPAHGLVQVGLPVGGARLELVSVAGRVVRARSVETATATLDLQGVPRGLYLLRTRTSDGKTASRRLLVE